MALTKTMSFSGTATKQGTGWSSDSEPCNFDVNNCHIKVISVDGGKNGLTAKVTITADGFSGYQQYSFVPKLEGQNFIAQAYEHLKTLPEFAGAIDC